MTEKRFYYNVFYHADDMSRVLEYEIIDRQSYPNYPHHNEKEDIPDWYIYIAENDSGWQDMLVDLLNEQDQKIKELKRMLQLVSESTSARTENSVKEIIRNNLFGLDSVAGESANAFNDYITLKKFFKKYYNEHWDNDKFD